MTEGRTIRLTAGALAALWLALPVAAAVHGSLVAHQYCAEHRAFEHVDAPDAAPARAPFDGPTLTATVTAALHNHCLFDEALLHDARPQRPPAHAVRIARALPGTPPPAEAPPAAPILIHAPKTSPPALTV